MLPPHLIEAIVLAIIQGITEFLPISSSGHLVILQQPLDRLLGISPGAAERLELSVAVHVGTLCSILAVYGRELPLVLRDRRLVMAIVVATIPAALVGPLFLDRFEQVFETPLVAGAGLLITALVLSVAQLAERGRPHVKDVSMRTAVAVGLFQACALLPGISRSGSTIGAGLLFGLRRETAALFSFMIAIPAILGAAVLTVWKHRGAMGDIDGTALLVGAVISAVVGFAALRFLLAFLTKGKLHWFAVYCCLAGAATILSQIL